MSKVESEKNQVVKGKDAHGGIYEYIIRPLDVGMFSDNKIKNNAESKKKYNELYALIPHPVGDILAISHNESQLRELKNNLNKKRSLDKVESTDDGLSNIFKKWIGEPDGPATSLSTLPTIFSDLIKKGGLRKTRKTKTRKTKTRKTKTKIRKTKTRKTKTKKTKTKKTKKRKLKKYNNLRYLLLSVYSISI